MTKRPVIFEIYVETVQRYEYQYAAYFIIKGHYRSEHKKSATGIPVMVGTVMDIMTFY